MGDPWRLLATISEPQLCFGREISLKGPLDTVEIVIEYMDMVDNVNMDLFGVLGPYLYLRQGSLLFPKMEFFIKAHIRG